MDFVEKSNDRHHQWMMRMNGARLALVEEAPTAALNVSLLKSMSGGDKQIANAMRKDDETWMPTHTLLFTSNVAPDFANDVEGMLRRYVPLPTGEKTWKTVADYEPRLHEEAEAVLAWLVRGTGLWITEDSASFDPDALPDRIQTLRDAHILDEDPYSTFIESYLEITGDRKDSIGRTALRELFAKSLGDGGDHKPLGAKDSRLTKLMDKLNTMPGVSTTDHYTGPNGRERGWHGVCWFDPNGPVTTLRPGDVRAHKDPKTGKVVIERG